MVEIEDEIKVLQLFEKKAKELYDSRFTKSLSGSGVTVKWKKGEGFVPNLRKGPDYESIKAFAITFRNFSLDSDLISIRNIAKMYEKLGSNDSLKKEFMEARKEFNKFLDSYSFIVYNGGKLTYRKIINTYIYGDVIHLEKNDEFKQLIFISPMADLIFNDIVYILGIAANFIYYFNSINQKYLKKIATT